MPEESLPSLSKVGYRDWIKRWFTSEFKVRSPYRALLSLRLSWFPGHGSWSQTYHVFPSEMPKSAYRHAKYLRGDMAFWAFSVENCSMFVFWIPCLDFVFALSLSFRTWVWTFTFLFYLFLSFLGVCHPVYNLCGNGTCISPSVTDLWLSCYSSHWGPSVFIAPEQNRQRQADAQQWQSPSRRETNYHTVDENAEK